MVVRYSLRSVWLILLSFQNVTIPALAMLQAASDSSHGDFAVDPGLVPANTKEEAADTVVQAADTDWLSSGPDLTSYRPPHGLRSQLISASIWDPQPGSADIILERIYTTQVMQVHLPTINLDPSSLSAVGRGLMAGTECVGRTSFRGRFFPIFLCSGPK
jgi:hypothetical protein